MQIEPDTRSMGLTVKFPEKKFFIYQTSSAKGLNGSRIIKKKFSGPEKHLFTSTAGLLGTIIVVARA